MRARSRASSHPLAHAELWLFGLGACVLVVTKLALRQHHAPERCPAGMTPTSARCCGAGQISNGGACAGHARSCSSAQALSEDGQCLARPGVVSFEGGELYIGSADWDGQDGGERFPRSRVAPFRLDVTEVTIERYAQCEACSAQNGEPGLPVTNVSASDAERFCQSVHGRLPSGAEWVWAAAGAAARRYAWGNSGLVCRRAAFGLQSGPCSTQNAPELAGSRPDGATPEGVLDLAGNVAEWTREPDGSHAARGGSFRSTSAAELKSWARSADREKALYIGFRCAYPP